ncbi:MAG: thioredoxin-like domain-containing protein [Planctomycetota bacterium]|jgi:thiol-disulfide isomerase/thioredoxin
MRRFLTPVAVLLVAAAPILASSSSAPSDRPRALQRAVDRYEGAIAKARTRFEDEVARAYGTLEKAYRKDIRRAANRDADLAAYLEDDLKGIREQMPKIGGASHAPAKPGTQGFGALANALGPALELADGSRVPVESALANRTHALVYFSASWCPPCKKFTPKLVQYAQALGPNAPMAVILVSSDKDANKQRQYMQQSRMPFFATVWNPQQNGALKRSLCGGRGIPSLTLVDANGEILARSYVDGQYRGVDSVLQAAVQAVPARR